MITSSPFFQFTGVATLCFAVSCMESITRRISSKLRPVVIGRNFDEILRVIDSMQLTAKHKVATPVNWKNGDDVIIAGSVSDDDAKKQYPNGWKAPRPYLRIVPQPK